MIVTKRTLWTIFACSVVLVLACNSRSRGVRLDGGTIRTDTGPLGGDGGVDGASGRDAARADAGSSALGTYEPCALVGECVPGDECVEITVTNPSGRTVTDSMCTHSCFDDLDCPTSPGTGLPGACYEVGGASPLCYERCDFDSDCPIGFGCYPTTGVSDAICLPL